MIQSFDKTSDYREIFDVDESANEICEQQCSNLPDLGTKMFRFSKAKKLSDLLVSFKNENDEPLPLSNLKQKNCHKF